MFQKIALALSVLTLSVAAHATQYNGTRTYFVQYHFTTEAFGKKVAAVQVHTGVLQNWCGTESWNDIKDVAMKLDGDRFNARVELQGQVSSGCGGAIAPIVEYKVTFEDGTVFTTNAAQVNTTSIGQYDQLSQQVESNNAISAQSQTFQAEASADRTEGVWIQIGMAD